MPLWKFVPATHETDPRWQGRPIFSEVLVRAETAGMARRIAADFELPAAPDDTARSVGNGSEPLGSALEDEKLYRMVVMDDATADALLPPEHRHGGEGVVRAVRDAEAETRRVGGVSPLNPG